MASFLIWRPRLPCFGPAFLSIGGIGFLGPLIPVPGATEFNFHSWQARKGEVKVTQGALGIIRRQEVTFLPRETGSSGPEPIGAHQKDSFPLGD